MNKNNLIPRNREGKKRKEEDNRLLHCIVSEEPDISVTNKFLELKIAIILVELISIMKPICHRNYLGMYNLIDQKILKPFIF